MILFTIITNKHSSHKILSQTQLWSGPMGWDGIYCGYWCRHRSKDCSKAHHLPSQASPLWVGRVIPKNNLPHGHVCTVEFTQTGATLLYYNIQILQRKLLDHRRRKLLETTEGGSCSKPQKEEVTRNHRRRKLLETIEGGSCSTPGIRGHKGEIQISSWIRFQWVPDHQALM